MRVLIGNLDDIDIDTLPGYDIVAVYQADWDQFGNTVYDVMAWITGDENSFQNAEKSFYKEDVALRWCQNIAMAMRLTEQARMA